MYKHCTHGSWRLSGFPRLCETRSASGSAYLLISGFHSIGKLLSTKDWQGWKNRSCTSGYLGPKHWHTKNPWDASLQCPRPLTRLKSTSPANVWIAWLGAHKISPTSSLSECQPRNDMVASTLTLVDHGTRLLVSQVVVDLHVLGSCCEISVQVLTNWWQTVRPVPRRKSALLLQPSTSLSGACRSKNGYIRISMAYFVLTNSWRHMEEFLDRLGYVKPNQHRQWVKLTLNDDKNSWWTRLVFWHARVPAHCLLKKWAKKIKLLSSSEPHPDNYSEIVSECFWHTIWK